MTMSGINLNLDFCCTCLKLCTDDDIFIKLSYAPFQDITYKNKLKSCIPELVLESLEESSMCKTCSVALETAYTFRCMCLRTQSKLANIKTTQRQNYDLSQKIIKQELLEILSDDEKCEYDEPKNMDNSERTSRYVPNGAYTILCDDDDNDEDCVEQSTSRITSHSSKSEDDRIQVVKDELGYLLTSSLGVNLEKNLRASSSKDLDLNFFNTLNKEIKEIKEIEKSSSYNLLAGTKTLCDEEIIENACKTIPDLQKIPAEALKCWVVLEKMSINGLPMIISKSKNDILPNIFYKDKNNSKVFWCHVCNKYMNRKDRYKSHLYKHSNIKGYKCSFCPEAFCTYDSLRGHRKRMHSQSPSKIESAIKSHGDPEITVSTSTKESLSVGKAISKPNKVLSISKTEISSINKDKGSPQIKSQSKNKKMLIRPTSIEFEKRERKLKADLDIKNQAVLSTKSKSKIGPLSSKIRRSLRQQTIAKYHCECCSYETYRKERFDAHLLKHVTIKLFECHICKRRYSEQSSLNKHVRRQHKQPESATIKPVITKSPSTKKSSIKHQDKIIIKKEIQCDSTELESITTGKTDENLIQELSHENQSLQCKKCNIDFPSLDLLNIHNQSHKVILTCKTCNASFDNKSSFHKHLTTHQSRKLTEIEIEAPLLLLTAKKKKKKYFCPICNMEFSHRDHANVHTGDKPYKCKVCNKDFAAYTSLRRHKWTHSDDKSDKPSKQIIEKYWCEICKNEFDSQGEIYSHNCQNSAGESIYRCQICKNAFLGRSSLIQHMGTHMTIVGT